MTHIIILSALLVLLSPICICIASSSDVVTENLKLYVDGQEFFIKAMCYSPVPLGQGVTDANGDIGGGFCSPKVTPFGSIVTTCYDSDYFDGGPDAADREQPTEGGWFQPVWSRDFPLMKSLGANTLRLYSTNPTTKQASIYYPEVVPLPLGKDHVLFMDMAAEYNFKVIFPLIGDYGMMTTYDVPTFKRLLRWQIDEVGNHTALLMWGFGNELPLYSNSALISLLNVYITYIKQYTLTKWGRKIPVTTAVVDLPNSYDTLAATLDVDVFTTNAGYRGFTFTDLWAGNSVTQGWYELSCKYNKPVFIGELGWQSMNNAITISNPDWFNQLWKDLIGHIDQGCIGGAFFEYSDEPLKPSLQQTMGVVMFQVNTTGGLPSTEEYVWSADIATPKNIIFNAVQSGSYLGQSYNMNANPFSLAGRAQSLLSTSQPICSNFNFVDCPAQNTCSFHGICNRQLGTCTCNAGWTGADCSQPVCSSGCSGSGTCVSTVSPPVCNCLPGITGSICNVQASPSTCSNNCVNGNGLCDSTGKCVCYNGWWGHDCSIPDISYPPIASVPATLTSSLSTASTATTTTTTTTSSTTSKPISTTGVKTTTSSTTSKPTTSTTAAKSSTTTTGKSATTTTAATTGKSATTTTAKSASTTTTAKSATTTTAKSATTTAKSATTTTSTTTTKSATSTTAGISSASTSSTGSSSTSVKFTTTTTTSPTTTTVSTTTTGVNTQCGALQSCGKACFDPNQYNCYNGILCPTGTQLCGTGCFNPQMYICTNNQLTPK